VRGFTQDDATSSARRSRSKTSRSCLQFAVDTLTNYGFTQYEASFHVGRGASGKYDGSPDQWLLGENALRRPPNA